MRITALKQPWLTPELCWLIRTGRFKSTVGVRSIAKRVSFAQAYGVDIKTFLESLKGRVPHERGSQQ